MWVVLEPFGDNASQSEIREGIPRAPLGRSEVTPRVRGGWDLGLSAIHAFLQCLRTVDLILANGRGLYAACITQRAGSCRVSRRQRGPLLYIIGARTLTGEAVRCSGILETPSAPSPTPVTDHARAERFIKTIPCRKWALCVISPPRTTVHTYASRWLPRIWLVCITGAGATT